MPATGSVYRHITRSRIWQRGRRCVWTAAWPNTWTFMSVWDASWRSSPSRMRSWWGKQLLAADKDWWQSGCRHALWRGGGISDKLLPLLNWKTQHTWGKTSLFICQTLRLFSAAWNEKDAAEITSLSAIWNRFKQTQRSRPGLILFHPWTFFLISVWAKRNTLFRVKHNMIQWRFVETLN